MLIVPEKLVKACRKTPERRAWLEELPNAIRELQDKWSLSLETPFDCDEVSCAWVAPAVRNGHGYAVLKLGMPHMEGEHEIQALRFWQAIRRSECWRQTRISTRCCLSSACLERRSASFRNPNKTLSSQGYSAVFGVSHRRRIRSVRSPQ